MGQKAHPKTLRIGKFNEWNSIYHEKKLSEFKTYSFQDLNFKSFLRKFLKDNGMILSKLRLKYTNNSVIISISYYLSFESIFYNNIKAKNIRLIPKEKPKKQKTSNLYLKTTKKYLSYKQLKNKIYYKKLTKTKNTIQKELNRTKIKRIKTLKFYKNKEAINNNANLNQMENKSFLEKLLNNLKLFNKKNKNIFITFEQLNKNVKSIITKTKIKSIKKILVKLRKYKQSEFFKEGLNMMFLSINNCKNSPILLSQFISNNLKKLKRHNFFLRFIKTSLGLFTNKVFSDLKGIRIKIKGRLNGTPRARHKIIKIKNGVSALTLNSNINYSESVAFTTNGTIGVKVWVEEN